MPKLGMPKLTFPSSRSSFNLLFPEGYPQSVRGSYRQFMFCNLAQMTFSSALGVLSTQQLLLALGVGSISSSAALNWVMKDGLGQLGGVLFAGKVGRRFDVDVKHYRWMSSLVLNLACCLEMAAPSFPAHFLLIASLSTTGKNISYLSASASKAAINLSFCNAHNLADITAKNGTQTTAACLLGMALGTSLAYYCPSFTHSLVAFSVCSALNLAATWLEMQYVTLRTINVSRGGILFRHYFNTGVFITPEEANKQEQILARGKIAGLRLCDTPPDLDYAVSSCPQPNLPSYLLYPHHSEVYLLFSETCSDTDMLFSFVSALSLLWKAEIKHEVVRETLVAQLQEKGWDLHRTFLEPRNNRYRLNREER